MEPREKESERHVSLVVRIMRAKIRNCLHMPSTYISDPLECGDGEFGFQTSRLREQRATYTLIGALDSDYKKKRPPHLGDIEAYVGDLY